MGASNALSPLCHAAKVDAVALARLLVDRLSIPIHSLDDALLVAASNGSPEIVSFLSPICSKSALQAAFRIAQSEDAYSCVQRFFDMFPLPTVTNSLQVEYLLFLIIPEKIIHLKQPFSKKRKSMRDVDVESALCPVEKTSAKSGKRFVKKIIPTKTSNPLDRDAQIHDFNSDVKDDDDEMTQIMPSSPSLLLQQQQHSDNDDHDVVDHGSKFVLYYEPSQQAISF